MRRRPAMGMISATFATSVWDDSTMAISCLSAPWPSPRPLAVRPGYVKCGYCATSQKRPDDGKCCGCGGPTPHTPEAIYA
jgi:hypothetical protein